MKRYKTPREYMFFLLGRREYSVKELTEKSLKYFPDHEATVLEMIKKFQEKNLVSDDRFCEAFIRSEVQRGSGRRKIIQRLMQKGIELSVAKDKCEALIDNQDILESACQLADKKRAQILRRKPNFNEYEIRGKITQFLVGRGFDFDIIDQAIKKQLFDDV